MEGTMRRMISVLLSLVGILLISGHLVSAQSGPVEPRVQTDPTNPRMAVFEAFMRPT
jgi:hypothetical protein